jgi:hypothetical protein
VATDLKGGMRELIAHLIEAHGCQRIALIHGPETQDAAVALFQGYREALEQHDLPFVRVRHQSLKTPHLPSRVSPRVAGRFARPSPQPRGHRDTRASETTVATKPVTTLEEIFGAMT